MRNRPYPVLKCSRYLKGITPRNPLRELHLHHGQFASDMHRLRDQGKMLRLAGPKHLLQIAYKVLQPLQAIGPCYVLAWLRTTRRRRQLCTRLCRVRAEIANVLGRKAVEQSALPLACRCWRRK